MAIGLALGAAGGCGRVQEAEAAQPLRIASGGMMGVYSRLGGALADLYNNRISGLVATALPTTGATFNMQAVEEGRAELGFTHADTAYLAVREGTSDRPQPYRHVRAIAVLYPNAVQVVVLRAGEVRHLSDLRHRRVGGWRPGFARTRGAISSGTELTVRIIMQELNLEDRALNEPLAFSDLASRIAERDIDVGFFVSPYPIPALTGLNASSGIRLLSVPPELAARVRTAFPFYRPITVPAGTYTGQNEEIATIGVDNLLVCRDDLPDELVYRLTRTFFESIETLAEAHNAVAAMKLENASAAPIPLHPGAARYYRERELFP
jgi:TRAP transporter TAXI family solute receptor